MMKRLDAMSANIMVITSSGLSFIRLIGSLVAVLTNFPPVLRKHVSRNLKQVLHDLHFLLLNVGRQLFRSPHVGLPQRYFSEIQKHCGRRNNLQVDRALAELLQLAASLLAGGEIKLLEAPGHRRYSFDA